MSTLNSRVVSTLNSLRLIRETLEQMFATLKVVDPDAELAIRAVDEALDELTYRIGKHLDSEVAP